MWSIGWQVLPLLLKSTQCYHMLRPSSRSWLRQLGLELLNLLCVALALLVQILSQCLLVSISPLARAKMWNIWNYELYEFDLVRKCNHPGCSLGGNKHGSGAVKEQWPPGTTAFGTHQLHGHGACVLRPNPEHLAPSRKAFRKMSFLFSWKFYAAATTACIHIQGHDNVMMWLEVSGHKQAAAAARESWFWKSWTSFTRCWRSRSKSWVLKESHRYANMPCLRSQVASLKWYSLSSDKP